MRLQTLISTITREKYINSIVDSSLRKAVIVDKTELIIDFR